MKICDETRCFLQINKAWKKQKNEEKTNENWNGKRVKAFS